MIHDKRLALLPGTRLGAYEVNTQIGAGGMGEVYKGRDTRAISSLNHPHICTLFDVGHHNGVDFLVLEYLEGPAGKTRRQRTEGSQPVWRADGKELFYVGADGTMMAVPIDATGQVTGVAQTLFPTSTRVGPSGPNQTFAVTKDGKRFLVSTTPEQSPRSRCQFHPAFAP